MLGLLNGAELDFLLEYWHKRTVHLRMLLTQLVTDVGKNLQRDVTLQRKETLNRTGKEDNVILRQHGMKTNQFG